MKNFLIFCMLLFMVSVHAQLSVSDENISLDQKLSNVDKSSVTSGIIYERTASFANLYNFNRLPDFKMANYTYFKQALLEMHLASNKTQFISPQSLETTLVPATYIKNVVGMGVLNTPFQILNYNGTTPSAGGLTYDAVTNRFTQIPGKPPFYTLHSTVISPLKEFVEGEYVDFKWSDKFIFQNVFSYENRFFNTKQIKSLTVDYGTGTTYSVMSNFKLENSFQRISYPTSGEKVLTFNVVYYDNSTLTTYAKINYKKLESFLYQSFSDVSCGSDYGLIEDKDSDSYYSWQGYEESFAFKGYIKYRIFYKNGTDGKIRKPIIIIDGFDPENKRQILPCDYQADKPYVPGKDRAISDLMKYQASDGSIKDLISELQNKGYDVIVVNHPTYHISKTFPHQRGEPTPATYNSYIKVDGGADYIERNGLNLVTLIQKINTELKNNGSTEKLVIVGPSMGGQISRYALAWMEKNGIPHNTRLWVSVDSPHLGANIPMGDQALVSLLTKKSESARDFYYNQLGSPAGKQQLIELHRDAPNHHEVNTANLNARTISQGFSFNSGHDFYQKFYNNQFNNGLSGSKGYPLNVRKIALTNGSLTGKKNGGSDSEKVLNIRGFQRVCIDLPFGMSYCFDVHIASLESHFMPTYGTGLQRIARFKSGLDDTTTISPNINSRGNMDTLPGGWFPAQNDLARSILGEYPKTKEPITIGGSYWSLLIYEIFTRTGRNYFELREFRPTNSFIPTFSALGIKNPDQDWGQPLNRNLVCSKETPFDSYYGEEENTQHTSFNAGSINWLFNELEGKSLPPSYPAYQNSIVGNDLICTWDVKKFSLPSAPVGSTYKWFVNTGSTLQFLNGSDTKSIAEIICVPIYTGDTTINVIVSTPGGCTYFASKTLKRGGESRPKIELSCVNTYCPCWKGSYGVADFDFVKTTNNIKPAYFEFNAPYFNNINQYRYTQRVEPISDGNGNWIGHFYLSPAPGYTPNGTPPLILEAKARANECSEYGTYMTYIGGCYPNNGRMLNSEISNTSKKSFIATLTPNPASNKVIVGISENPFAVKNCISSYEGRMLSDAEVQEYRKKLDILEANKKLPFTVQISNIDNLKVKEFSQRFYGEIEIPIANLPAGIYFVTISNGAEQIVEKLIKN